VAIRVENVVYTCRRLPFGGSTKWKATLLKKKVEGNDKKEQNPGAAKENQEGGAVSLITSRWAEERGLLGRMLRFATVAAQIEIFGLGYDDMDGGYTNYVRWATRNLFACQVTRLFPSERTP